MTADVEATTRCSWVNTSRNFHQEELDVPVILKIFNKNPSEIKLIGLKHINLEAS
jgi:DNA polymerase-3 subunit alpha